MDNLTTTLDILVNDDISAQTYDIIQKIANNTSVGTTPQLSEFTSSGTWSLPSIKPKFIYVLMVGGGGSGSARRTSGYGSAGG
ncbi:MAG TPA: hypothetical protein PLM63_03235 [bacterium]|nr:hypothetical protein [bacterium]